MKIVKLICLLFLAVASQAQQDTIIRYWRYGKDSSSPNIETRDLKLAVTRSVYYKKNGLWKMESRYLTGGPYMNASYSDADRKINEGEYITYHKNGKLETKTFYVNDKVEGLFQTWHDNGRPKDSFFMKAGLHSGNGFSWDKDGNVVAVFQLDRLGNGGVKYFNDKRSVSSEGEFVEGAKNGNWNFFSDEGVKEWEVLYLKDSVLSYKCFSPDGQIKEGCVFEREAAPAGGVRVWGIWLAQEIDKQGYPSRKISKHKKASELSGQVSVRFLVDKDGSVIDAEVVKSLNEEADRIALHVIQSAPKWIPGIYKNKYVKSYRTQPVTFVVND